MIPEGLGFFLFNTYTPETFEVLPKIVCLFYKSNRFITIGSNF